VKEQLLLAYAQHDLQELGSLSSLHAASAYKQALRNMNAISCFVQPVVLVLAAGRGNWQARSTQATKQPSN
jgi:hypothetical protein